MVAVDSGCNYGSGDGSGCGDGGDGGGDGGDGADGDGGDGNDGGDGMGLVMQHDMNG